MVDGLRVTVNHKPLPINFILMARFIIQGGQPLRGTIQPLGNKNAALPMLAACLLPKEPITLSRVPLIDDVRSMLELLEHHDGPSALYLGRKFNFPTALEGALKNKEISYQHAEGYAAGEMKHGPIALINEYLPVICICTQTSDDVYDKMISNMKEVEARHGRIIAVATDGDKHAAAIAEDIIFVPATRDEFSPMVNVVALQLLAYYAAHARGTDIDKPRNLAKSVTVE